MYEQFQEDLAGWHDFFMKYQKEHWNQGFGLFFETMATQTEHLAAAIAQGDWKLLLGLWFPNIVCTFASLVLVIKAAPRLRPSYLLFFAAYFVIACGATWLLSSPRYLTASFVVPMALAALADTNRKDSIATVISTVLMVLYLFMYANGWYVY